MPVLRLTQRVYRKLQAAVAGDEELCRLIRPVKKKRPPDGREARQKQHQEDTAAIRAAVMERACWRCENCGGVCPGSALRLEMDHMLSGSGRRRQRQSVETCWALCGGKAWTCHSHRTANFPSWEHWRARMREHLTRHGYPIPRELEE